MPVRRVREVWVRDEMIDVGELAVRVRIAGDGPPLLFTSTGWGPSVDLYLQTLDRLQQRFTVAWVDPRRTGRSGRPDGGSYDLDAVVGDFDAVRRALGWDSMHVGGHSMGGHLALRYLASYPDRCSGVLVLCAYGDMDDQYRTEMASRMQARSNEPWFPSVAEAFSRSPATDAEFEQMLLDALPLYFVDQARLEAIAPQLASVTWSVDAFPYLGTNPEMAVLDRIRGSETKALVVAAEGDFICSPPLGRRIRDALPNSTLVEIPDSGHFPWVEQPEQFWSAVEAWLDDR